MYEQTPRFNGYSTDMPDMDFETYSEAGCVYVNGKWRSSAPGKNKKKGLSVVGAAAYSEHPSTEVLCLAYNLKDGYGRRLWIPGAPPPQDLFDHIAGGGLIEAHNSLFEYFIWKNVCHARMGWPELPLDQLRCSMSKANAFSLPGALSKSSEVLRLAEQKDKRGQQLITQLCMPKNPTKNDNSLRRTPQSHPKEFAELYEYCLQDIKTESALSGAIPDLTPYELEVWKLDQKINARGVYIDRDALADCLYIVEAATLRYTEELQQITRGAVGSVDETEKLRIWLSCQGLNLPNMQAETVTAQLERTDLTESDPRRRVLWIRSSLGSNSVKKLHSIKSQISSDGRLRDLFVYHGPHTGRFAGRGPQPQNLPSSGPPTVQCTACGGYYAAAVKLCPYCGQSVKSKKVEWSSEIVEDALRHIARRDIDLLLQIWGDPIAVVAGCLRGLFTAEPGKELICSDFSAIEAVVLAVLAGCQWRIDVFRTHGKIYEMSASKITGVPFQEFLDHKERNGEHHPLRKKVGKVAELASGYQGWIGAWRQFGADDFFKDEDSLKAAILAWRDASPEIPQLWKGLENCFAAAVLSPGRVYQYRGIAYGMRDGIVFCCLPSGRCLKYHNARAERYTDTWGRTKYRLSFDGWDSVLRKWGTIETYGGRLTENVVQAVARDIQVNAMLKTEDSGYPVVLHVHDEVCSEVPAGFGSVEHFERRMVDALEWFQGWPIKAAGGWRGRRYRKD